MEKLVLSIITLFVGAAVFIVGMNMMSSGLRKSTGRGLRKLLKRIRNNRLAGFGIGTTVTTLIQSSAATGVMVIGFIGAGAIIAIYVYNYKKFGAFIKACLMLMLVGALGNLIDRLFYTASFLHAGDAVGVVDWIDFAGIHFAVFNIADSCVVVGVFMLIVWLIIDEVKATRAKRAQEVKENNGKVLSKEEQKRLEQQGKEEKVEEPKEEEQPQEESEKK